MLYRPFGKTDVQVSALGFGAMRLPRDEEAAVRLIRKALDLGVNYVDTAPGYLEGLSEEYVGTALQGRREQVYLATKNPIQNASGADWRKRLDASLERLKTDYIDFYHMWSITWDIYTQRIIGPNGPLAEARKAQSEGVIRHLCFSVHDKPENIIKIIDTGEFETMLCQYNLLDRANEGAIEHAYKRGMGVAIMGPIGGGRLATPTSAIGQAVQAGAVGTPEVALRFVLSNPYVSVALSGMTSTAMIEENARIASMEEPLSETERQVVIASLDHFAELSKLYCTGCNYCMPCPNDIAIPRVFELMNHHRIWGLTDHAVSSYQQLVKRGRGVDQCVECGVCESKCPQKIEIIRQLKECAAVLGA
ncbi:MAG TPA: aldo/keto reductase [Firmicutes bacterium]|nr:aldo/keto reductase [Bacillota bacterium]